MFDYYFWFTAPSSVLNKFDYAAGYVSAALVVLAIVFVVLRRASKVPQSKKLLSRFYHLSLTTGILGLIWFGFRYENTYFFSTRYWVGLILLSALIWKGFILAYVFTAYPKELEETKQKELRDKYLKAKK